MVLARHGLLGGRGWRCRGRCGGIRDRREHRQRADENSGVRLANRSRDGLDRGARARRAAGAHARRRGRHHRSRDGDGVRDARRGWRLPPADGDRRGARRRREGAAAQALARRARHPGRRGGGGGKGFRWRLSPRERAQAVIDLLDAGNTVPFITRYRKDQTGGLDEEQIRQIQQRAVKLRMLLERKQTILRSIESQGKLVEELLEHYVVADFIRPTFVIDYPVDTSPLVRDHRSIKGVVEKWDLYVDGFELATGYSELIDPVIQRERLEEQARLGAKGDEEAMPLDEDFLRAMEFGMPPMGGMGMGADRLLMALTGLGIRETILFPLVKPEQD